MKAMPHCEARPRGSVQCIGVISNMCSDAVSYQLRLRDLLCARKPHKCFQTALWLADVQARLMMAVQLIEGHSRGLLCGSHLSATRPPQQDPTAAASLHFSNLCASVDNEYGRECIRININKENNIRRVACHAAAAPLSVVNCGTLRSHVTYAACGGAAVVVSNSASILALTAHEVLLWISSSPPTCCSKAGKRLVGPALPCVAWPTVWMPGLSPSCT